MSRTRIKICGIRTPEIALAAIDAGADAIGFMFVRSSVRSIDPEEAAAIMWGLPPMVTTVGVFMNASAASFADIEEVCPTHLAQLHGNEDVDTVKACGPAIKAIRYNAATIKNDLAYWSAIDEVDAILIDGSAGGEGTTLDWKGLAAAIADTEQLAPLILAGGLTPDNVEDAIHTVRPFAVDVSSGVESERGVKSPELIERFCAAVRRADASS